MTTTLLHPMPAPRPGALIPEHLDPRPCTNNPPQWWDTGHPRNADAALLCETRCPLYNACKPHDGEEVVGVIRAGTAYDDCGRAVNPTPTAHHHEHIADMYRRGHSYAAIAHTLGFDPRTIRKYCVRHFKPRPLIVKPSRNQELVERWVRVHADGMTIREAAELLGVDYRNLKDVLGRARRAGDTRIPRFRSTSPPRQVAA